MCELKEIFKLGLIKYVAKVSELNVKKERNGQDLLLWLQLLVELNALQKGRRKNVVVRDLTERVERLLGVLHFVITVECLDEVLVKW